MYRQWKKLAEDIVMRYDRIEQKIQSSQAEYNKLYQKMESYLATYNYILSDTNRSPKALVSSRLIKNLNEKLDRLEQEGRQLYDTIRRKGPQEEEFYKYICQRQYAQIERMASQEKYEAALWFYGCYKAGQSPNEGMAYFEQLTESAEYGIRAKDALFLIRSDNVLSELDRRYESNKRKHDDEAAKICSDFINEMNCIRGELQNAQISGDLASIAATLEETIRNSEAKVRKQIEYIAYMKGEEEKKERDRIEKEKAKRREEKQKARKSRRHALACVVVLLFLISLGNIGFMGESYDESFLFLGWLKVPPFFSKKCHSENILFTLSPYLKSAGLSVKKNNSGIIIAPFADMEWVDYYSRDSVSLEKLSCVNAEKVGIFHGKIGSVDFQNDTTSIMLDNVSIDNAVIPKTVESLVLRRESAYIKNLEIKNQETKLDIELLSEEQSEYVVPGGASVVSLFEGRGITKLVIPDGVKELYVGECENLKDISLPEDLEKLEIFDCPSLTEIVVPNNVKEIVVNGETLTTIEGINANPSYITIN